MGEEVVSEMLEYLSSLYLESSDNHEIDRILAIAPRFINVEGVIQALERQIWPPRVLDEPM